MCPVNNRTFLCQPSLISYPVIKNFLYLSSIPYYYVSVQIYNHPNLSSYFFLRKSGKDHG